MRRLNPRHPVYILAGLLTAALLFHFLGGSSLMSRPTVAGVAAAVRRMPYEDWARREFYRRHPGEKPLNWAIGAAAVEFHKTRPMGRFVLCLEPNEWGNDCSDFVQCAIDEGLGVQARFNRDAKDHLYGTDPRLWHCFYWKPGVAVQPGDIVRVRHSPWYEPYDGACWHAGIMGADGQAYDFSKLKRWRSARYGRHTFEWFIRHSHGPKQVAIGRLRPEYRYRIEPLPEPAQPREPSPAS